MNRAMLEQMMARMQTGSMLPPPPGAYAPGGSMFPQPTQDVPVDPNAPSAEGTGTPGGGKGGATGGGGGDKAKAVMKMMIGGGM
jgi:hypothetical protein